ncbi:MAG TPA: DinB family protein [Tepidisphaeraceae bacterium]|jgi:uncharacterized damage-inducible protein DinB|nr:DinB family protein [Tepidisphaeraceae bacterium]
MTILERLLRHDAWTTKKLLELSRQLPDADLDREFDIGHRTLRRTFAHIVANMECWADLMAAKPQRWNKNNQPGNSIEELIARLDTVSSDLLAIGMRVDQADTPEGYFTDYLDSPPRNKPLGAGMVHIATHGMHHRAQCLYIMRMLGISNLIEGDAISWEREHRGLDKWPAA